ncbi:hypothetical protein [Azorhizobium sp. AG788]|uniref:hypothetical protein n=1 Tax=Azorhizobium sp. AG788 TaxID=2183897 RepID=UPI00313A1182
MSEAINLALHDWIEDVTTRGHNHRLASHSLDAVVAYEAAAGNLTPTGIVVTGTQEVGVQQAELHDTQEKFGDKSSQAVDAMLRFPATGLMHISDLSRIAAGWNPTSLDATGANSKRYDDYINRLLKMPLLTLDYAEHQKIVRQSSNWDELINTISDLFTGITAQDVTQIRKSLTTLASAASTKASTDERTDLFCQSALNTGNDLYQLYLYSTNVTFHMEKGKGFETKQSTFEVSKLRLTLKYPLWTRQFVERLIGETSDSLDDWLNQNKTDVTKAPAVKVFL